MALALPAWAQEEPPPSEPSSTSGEAPVETIPVDRQQPEPPPSRKAEYTFDTIKVTAQRRTERLVDVPLAVTAMSLDMIEARDIARLDDLNSLAPGLQISRSPSNTTIPQMTIRGSSQINPAIYWDPSVGVYLDGVYIGKGQGAIFDVVDLAGVEVLRGPQGTLYGRNTIGGTINFITREPSGNFGGTAGLEYGSFNGRVLRGNVDLPRLLDFADINVGLRSERRDPWIETTPTSPTDGMNDRHQDGVHASAVMHVLPEVEGLYHFDVSETDQTNNCLQLVRSDDPNLQPYVHKERRDTADLNAPSAETSQTQGHSFTLTWNVTEQITFKSTSGYRKVNWVDKLDLDGSPRDTAHSERHTDYEQMSQDLNLSGKAGAWHYTLGAYYFADDGYTVNPIYVELAGAPIDFDSRYGTQAEAWAGYGQVDWNPVKPLTLAAGVRTTTEQKDLERVFGFRNSSLTPYNYYMPEGYRAPGTEFSATTPMASVAWRLTEQVNTYVRYAEGFKSGGYNGEYSDIQGTPESNQRETNTPFRPELQKSLEAGVKSSFFEGKTLVNVAAFHNKLEDLQVSIFTASGAAASVIRNAGKATIEGVELETAFVPFEGTSLRANYAYLYPVYDEFLDAGRNEAHNRAFVHAPRNSYNVVLDSEFLQTGWGALRATVDYAWTDEFYTYPYQLTMPGDPGYNSNAQSAPNTLVPGHGILNAKLGLLGIPLGGNRNGELALWGRNALDEDTVNNFIDFGPSFQNLTVANFVEPATFGLTGVLRF